MVTPGPSAADSRGRATGRPPRARVASATRDAQRVLDLGDGAVVRVEEGLVDRRPAAEVRDGEQRLRVRELRLVEVRRDDRAVAVLRERLLCGVGVEEVDELLRNCGCALRDRDRVLDEDRLVRRDVVDVLAGLLSLDRL